MIKGDTVINFIVEQLKSLGNATSLAYNFACDCTNDRALFISGLYLVKIKESYPNSLTLSFYLKNKSMHDKSCLLQLTVTPENMTKHVR